MRRHRAGRPLAVSQRLVTQTDVVSRPQCVIWPRCRRRLCSQTLSWKPWLHRNCFSFDFSSGDSHEKLNPEDPWFVSSVWKGAWNSLIVNVVSLSCVLQKPSLNWFVIVGSPPSLSLCWWCVMVVIKQNGGGERRGSSCGWRCVFLSAEERVQSEALTFGYLLTHSVRLADFPSSLPPVKQNLHDRSKKAGDHECQQPIKVRLVMATELPICSLKISVNVPVHTEMKDNQV